MSAESQHDYESTPYNVLTNEDGNVITPDLYDEHGEIETFVNPDVENTLLIEEQAAQDDIEASRFQEIMDGISSERKHAAQIEIDAHLAGIAVKKLVTLQNAVLDAAQTGDKVLYLRALKDLEKHIEDNPGIDGPSGIHE